CMPVDDLADLAGLVVRGEAQGRASALVDCAVAACTAEDEADRRQQAFPIEPGDHVGTWRQPEPAAVPPASVPGSPSAPATAAGIAAPRAVAAAISPAAAVPSAGAVAAAAENALDGALQYAAHQDALAGTVGIVLEQRQDV